MSSFLAAYSEPPPKSPNSEKLPLAKKMPPATTRKKIMFTRINFDRLP